MTNPFYTATGAPVQESRGTSPAVRNEFALLQTAFDEVFDAIDISAASGTSTDSLTVGTGSKSFTIQAGRAFSPGQSVVLAYNVTPTTQMTGTITSYNSATGAVVINVTGTSGSGTYADWTLSLSPSSGATLGANTFTGVQDWATGASIASASTVNLDSATGNRVHITGTTTITAWTLTRGPRMVIFDGALQLTYHATTNRLNSNGANVTVAAGDMAYIESDGTTVYVEVIKANGSAVVGVQTFGTAGTPAVINAGAASGVALCALTATRSIGLYTSSSGRPRAVLINSTTGAVLSTSGDLESVAISGATFDVKRLTDTTAVATWAISGAVKAVVLQNNSEAAAAGTVLSVEAVNSTAQALAVLSATKVLIVYSDTTNTRNSALTLTVTGTTLAANTRYSIHASTTAVQLSATALSATLALVTACNTGVTTQVQALPITEASNVLTFPAAWDAIAACGTANTVAYNCVSNVSASRALVVGGNSAGSTGRGLAMLVDVTGTGTAAVLWVGRPTPISPAKDIASAHRLQRLSATSFMHQVAGDSTHAASTVTHLVIDGDNVRPGASKTLARKVSHQDIAWHSAAPANAVALYVDGDNSSYPTTLQFSMGSIV